MDEDIKQEIQAEIADQGTERFPTWKWLVGGLITFIFILVGAGVSDMQGKINDLHKKQEQLVKDKLDKDQYYRDLAEIKTTLTKIHELQLAEQFRRVHDRR